MELSGSKSAIQSTSVLANVGGLFSGVLLTLAQFGYIVPEPTVLAILSLATVVSSVLGVSGRVKAKRVIDGVFFPRTKE